MDTVTISMTSNDRAFCTNCGADLPPDSVFCQECGSPVSEPDRMFSEGPEYVPATYNRHQDVYGLAKAESRLRIIRFLMIGYILLGAVIAASGLFFGQLLESLPIDDPMYISLLGEDYYEDMLSMVEPMKYLGMVFAASILMILGSLVLCFMRRHYTYALILSAAGSVVLALSMSLDSVLLVIIGLFVTYLLYTAKPAFTD